MAKLETKIMEAVKALPPKPADEATRSEKKRYSELVSRNIAHAVAAELRDRGLKNTRPGGPGEVGKSGAGRRMAGGIGAKKVDVTWTTDESGLMCAVSVKTINARDKRSQNYQKNLTNRRGDMLMEAVTLHRRFPYSVLTGLFVLYKDAETDGTEKRRSTFLNAHTRLKMFTGRADPAGRDEQLEFIYLLLLDATPDAPTIRAYAIGDSVNTVTLDSIVENMLTKVAERTPDFYEFSDGRLKKVGR